MKRAVRIAIALAAAGGLGIAFLVACGEHCIQRGARWTGVTYDDGVALVYVCDPASGIRRAYFYVWPWRRTALEKIDSGGL
ncbi:MAG TPA: hypothetical protein VN903_21135 [Polyangia bacterium]|nr:hypothetical protein [Polyangia bacterium]